MDYMRSQMQRIDWNSRLIGIKGPKGVGKSTLIQQYVRKTFGEGNRHALYCSADTGYFTEHTLVDTAARFVREGGTHLFIDESSTTARRTCPAGLSSMRCPACPSANTYGS